MKPKNLLFCFYLSILVGCSSPHIQNTPYILDDKLFQSYQNIDNSLNDKRSTLLFIGGREATDCNSYFDMVSKHRLEETVHNQLVKSEYLICDALKILSGSLGFSHEKVKVLNLGDELLSKLDIRSFPSSINRAGSDISHTLKSIYPYQTSYDDNVANLQTEDWSFILEAVALAGINDNSTPDWIVWVFDESKSGNYRGYSTIIIYDPREQETYKATTFP